MSRRAWLSAAAVVAYMALIFVLSSRRPPEPIEKLGVSDSWLHLVEYGVLGVLLADLAWARTRRVSWWVLVPLPALLGALYGLSDEWHQSFVPDRDASVADAIMDVAGAWLGATAYWLGRRLAGGG
jgi:VanZ family protein